MIDWMAEQMREIEDPFYDNLNKLYDQPNMLHTTHIAGIPHRKPDLGQLKVGESLALVPEPDNKFDPNAIRVVTRENAGPPIHLGYIPKTETNFFKDYNYVFIHSIRPDDRWHEVTIGNEPPQVESGFDKKD